MFHKIMSESEMQLVCSIGSALELGYGKENDSISAWTRLLFLFTCIAKLIRVSS